MNNLFEQVDALDNLLGDASQWTKNADARNASGVALVGGPSDDAVSWSLSGGADAVAEALEVDDVYELLGVICDAILAETGREIDEDTDVYTEGIVEDFNDAPATDFAAVKRVLARAKKLAVGR